MKALTLKEPYAGLIASGKKTIETRTWWPPLTMYPGKQEFIITAAKKPKTENSGLAICTARIEIVTQMTKDHEVVACCDIYPGAFSWFLFDVKRIKPFPVKGMLGFFEIDLEAMGIEVEYL